VSFTVVIPARYAASRLPGKPLREINGKPLLRYVYECAQRTQANQIIIATDDERIQQAANAFGADVCMTSDQHQNGTQRINEVIQQRNIKDDEIIVNLQGDEPLMPAACISQVARLLVDHPEAQMSTLATPVIHDDDVFDSNIVKVVMNKQAHALYFSRAPIPWQRGQYETQQVERTATWSCLRHIGIYGYRAGYSQEYVSLAQSPLEQLESLEQLRVLWHGGTIVVGLAEAIPGPGVDTEQDLEKVSQQLRQE